MTTLLTTHQLEVGYQRRAILPPIDVSVGQGEFWCVVGRNGSGKTTWFRTLLGLLDAVGGKIEWPEGRPPLAYVSQQSTFDALYPLSAREVVAQGRQRGWSLLTGKGDDTQAIDAAIERLDLGELQHQRFRSLSEGQKQKVLFARMLASEAELAFLDEPTAAMDSVAEAESMALLDALRRERQLTVVVVSHHLDVALSHAEHVLFLDQQHSAVVVGTPQSLVTDPRFQERYGRVPLPGGEA